MFPCKIVFIGPKNTFEEKEREKKRVTIATDTLHLRFSFPVTSQIRVISSTNVFTRSPVTNTINHTFLFFFFFRSHPTFQHFFHWQHFFLFTPNISTFSLSLFFFKRNGKKEKEKSISINHPRSPPCHFLLLRLLFDRLGSFVTKANRSRFLLRGDSNARSLRPSTLPITHSNFPTSLTHTHT